MSNKIEINAVFPHDYEVSNYQTQFILNLWPSCQNLINDLAENVFPQFISLCSRSVYNPAKPVDYGEDLPYKDFLVQEVEVNQQAMQLLMDWAKPHKLSKDWILDSLAVTLITWNIGERFRTAMWYPLQHFPPPPIPEGLYKFNFSYLNSMGLDRTTLKKEMDKVYREEQEKFLDNLFEALEEVNWRVPRIKPELPRNSRWFIEAEINGKTLDEINNLYLTQTNSGNAPYDEKTKDFNEVIEKGIKSIRDALPWIEVSEVSGKVVGHLIRVLPPPYQASVWHHFRIHSVG